VRYQELERKAAELQLRHRRVHRGVNESNSDPVFRASVKSIAAR